LIVKLGYDYCDHRFPNQKITIYKVLDVAAFALFVQQVDSKDNPFTLSDTAETAIVKKHWDIK
jgi:hypothetical protein